MTTGTAANIIKMMEYLPIHSLRGGCINHVIQLTINDDIPERLPRIILEFLVIKETSWISQEELGSPLNKT